MRALKWVSLSAVVFLLLGIFLARHEQIMESVGAYIENGDFLTLETRFTPEQIMDAQRPLLLGNSDRNYHSVVVKYHPYLLLDVKYTSPDKQTKEGSVLWSLSDGEILLNTATWERTHGYQDAIANHATRSDYRLMHALVKNNGSLTIDQLQKDLRIEEESMEDTIVSAKGKHLITLRGNLVQLHFQNPKLVIAPQSIIPQRWVTKPYSQSDWLPKRFTRSQIEQTAKAAFGSDFSIRSVQEVYLPVYSLSVLNPDGSILTSHWNPLNGQRL